jgi:hypothetical protein
MSWWDDQEFDPERDAGEDPYEVHANDRRFDPWTRAKTHLNTDDTPSAAPAPRRMVDMNDIKRRAEEARLAREEARR